MKTALTATFLLAASLSATEAIPENSKVYVAAMEGGFATYIKAAMANKKVPLIIVVDREKAEFEITGESETEKAGWARIVFKGQTHSSEQASINLVNIATSTVVFAYSANKMNSVHGKQSAAEACAKHLKEAILKK